MQKGGSMSRLRLSVVLLIPMILPFVAVAQTPEATPVATPIASPQASPEVRAVLQTENLVVGNADGTVPQGETGVFGVVLSGLVTGYGTELAIVVRNNTSGPLYQPWASATAKTSDGKLFAVGNP